MTDTFGKAHHCARDLIADGGHDDKRLHYAYKSNVRCGALEIPNRLGWQSGAIFF